MVVHSGPGAWFDAAQRRVPAYAPAQGRLAQIEAALGAHEARKWRFRAAARYSELTRRHPGVFVHHAADFRHPPNYRWDSR